MLADRASPTVPDIATMTVVGGAVGVLEKVKTTSRPCESDTRGLHRVIMSAYDTSSGKETTTSTRFPIVRRRYTLK